MRKPNQRIARRQYAALSLLYRREGDKQVLCDLTPSQLDVLQRTQSNLSKALFLK
jgi:hypothetical protein